MHRLSKTLEKLQVQEGKKKTYLAALTNRSGRYNVPQALPQKAREISASFKSRPELRKVSADILSLASTLESEMMSLEEDNMSRLSSGKEDMKRYINQKKEYLDKSNNFIKRMRAELSGQLVKKNPNSSDCKRWESLMKDLERMGKNLLRTRALHARDIARSRMLLQMKDQTEDPLPIAYFSALVRNMDDPEGAAIIKSHKFQGNDQRDFRRRMAKNHRDSRIPEGQGTDQLWCPITQKYWPAGAVNAAHIVPQCLGEESVAHLLGITGEDAYDFLWGTGNQMCLFKLVKNRFDNARIVIVPENDHSEEYKLVVLDESLLYDDAQKIICLGLPSWADLNNQRLNFNGHPKPNPKMLYAHWVISLLRRRNSNVVGWERDREKFPTKIWPSVAGTWLRKATLLALAVELGDQVPESVWIQDPLQGFTGSFKTGLDKSAREEADIATCMHAGWTLHRAK
jgi:hypothetical protein